MKFKNQLKTKIMGYRWRPSASQKAEYRAKMQAKQAVSTYTTPYAIRTGCYVEYFSVAEGCVIKGHVVKHSYGAESGQHTFTIQNEFGGKFLVKGRNLYPNIVKHIQGEESKKL